MIEYLKEICFASRTNSATEKGLDHYWCTDKSGETVLFLGNTNDELHIFTSTDHVEIKSIEHINEILGL